MKEDTPPPKRPPTKRSQLERVPDFWLAVWATNPELPEQDRDRAQQERDRRKALRPYKPVGVLVDREGVKTDQLEVLRQLLREQVPTEIHHPWVSRSVHGMCRSLGVPVVVHKDVRSEYAAMREVVLASSKIIAAPRGARKLGNSTPTWDSVLYAKHRRLAVTVVLPDGSVSTERE